MNHLIECIFESMRSSGSGGCKSPIGKCLAVVHQFHAAKHRSGVHIEMGTRIHLPFFGPPVWFGATCGRVVGEKPAGSQCDPAIREVQVGVQIKSTYREHLFVWSDGKSFREERGARENGPRPDGDA